MISTMFEQGKTVNQPSELEEPASCADSTAQQRWRLLFEQSPLSIQIFSPDGQTIHFNRAWSQLFGLTDEEAYAFNVLKDPNIERSGALPYIRKAFAGEVVYVPPVPFPVRRHSTQIRWIGGTVFPVISAEGVVQEVVVIHQDITDLKEVETTLHEIGKSLKMRDHKAKNHAHKNAALDELLKFIRDRLERYIHTDRRLPDFMDARPLRKLGLSGKEAETLLWVAKGKSNAEVADILGVTESTVKKHLEHIYAKLGVEKRGAASLLAIEQLSQ